MANLWDECNEGSFAGVIAALERGEVPDTRDTRGGDHTTTGLMVAVQAGHEEVVALLLERGADVNAVDTHLQTSLHWACFYGRSGVVRILLAQDGVNCNPRKVNGDTPLRLAVIGNHEESVRAMVGDGRVEVKDAHGEPMELSR